MEHVNVCCSHELTTYQRFLEHVFRAVGPVNSNNEPFRPKFMMSDFEKAIMGAGWALGIEMRFCLFHFIQAIIRLMDESKFHFLTKEQRKQVVGYDTDDSKRESIAYRMHFASNEMEFNVAVEQLKHVSTLLHETMVDRWVGTNNVLAKKYFRAFMNEEMRERYPQVLVCTCTLIVYM